MANPSMDADIERRRLPTKLVLLFLVVGGVAGAISGAAVSLVVGNGRSSDSAAGADLSTLERRVLVQEENLVSEAVAFAVPAVVTIVNQQAPKQDALGREFEEVSVGSGVIIDPRGFIVTNDHVVPDGAPLKVVLSEGQERVASFVSDDAPFTDLAVLRIAPGGFKALSLGDSDALVPGQTVVVIGSALSEFRNSVSAGVVSGLHRRWLREGVYMEDLVQTDAAINSGNSGGPLVNTKGEVVGISTTVVRQLGSAEIVYGISFAISSSTMKPIVSSIIERGFYPRPYLGVEHQNVDEDLARTARLGVARGALVRRVIDGGPAAAAGLRAGDVILRIGNNELDDELPFINALAKVGVNDRVTLEFWRGGRSQQVELALKPR